MLHHFYLRGNALLATLYDVMQPESNEPTQLPGLDALAERLRAGRRTIVLTGAGCSTESGIPDYRAPDGSWKRRQPIRIREFTRDDAARRRYWARSFAGWPRFRAVRPGRTHAALADLERAGRIRHVITQNVDELHQAAGSRSVTDLHGRLSEVVCLDCGARSARDEVQARIATLNADWDVGVREVAPDGDADIDAARVERFAVPDCLDCGGLIKPDVVFFGENVPRDRVQRSMKLVLAADLLLVVGSSLMVWSGYRFVRAATEAGIPVAIINLGRTRGDDIAALKLEAPSGETLSALCRAIRKDGEYVR
jgi:NAD-dependent SIR2 family protein deacetylase